MTVGMSRLAVTRRGALLGAGALAMPYVARAAEPIRIGVLLAKTGQIAPQTEYLAQGTYLALEERGNKIMGQPAELVWLDEPSPQGATQNMQKLVQENKVCAILGGSLSSNALAEEATAAQLKIPFVCDNAAATEITGKNCNRYTFRLNTPVLVQSRMLAPYALGYGKKWYFITASFAFGQDILRSSRELLKQAGGTEAGIDEVPLNTADFSSFILKIRQAQPDVVLGGLSAGDLSTFLKQWNELGMKGKIPFLRDRDRRHRHLGGRSRGGERRVHQAVVVQQPEQPAGGEGVRRRLHEEAQPPGGGQGMDGLDHREVAVRVDRAGEVHRADGDHRGPGELEVRCRRHVVQLPQVGPPDAAAEPGRVGEAEDHRQVGLLRC